MPLDIGDTTSEDVQRQERIEGLRARVVNNSRTIRSITALFTSNALSSVLTVVGGVLVARFAGPEVTGSFRAYTIPLGYLVFLHLGTWDGLSRQIPYYVGKEMPDRVDALASAAGAFNVLVSIAVSCGFLFCAAHSLLHHDVNGFFGWLSQVLCCWGLFYGNYLSHTYRTLYHFVTVARIQAYQALLNFCMVFTLPFLEFYGLCGRAAFPQLLSALLYHKHRPIKVRYRFDREALWELLRIGFPFSFWGNLYTSVWRATEGALVLWLGGVNALGLFSVAAVMREAVSSLPTAILQVLMPRVVTEFAREGSVRSANARVAWVTAGLTGFMALLAIAGTFLLDIFVPWFIPKYTAGIPVMKVSLWFPVVWAAFLPTNTLFATGRAWLYGRSIIPAIIVFALATYLLVPLVGGLLAVAIGSLLGRVARTLAAYVDLLILIRREA